MEEKLFILQKKCVNWPKDIVSIKCDDHVLLLNSTGQVYSCGSNYYGQLGLGNKKIQKKNRSNFN